MGKSMVSCRFSHENQSIEAATATSQIPKGFSLVRGANALRHLRLPQVQCCPEGGASMEWLKGTFLTGKHHISWENRKTFGFP